MTIDSSPFAAPIDRALSGVFDPYLRNADGKSVAEEIRDAIIAEIEAEFGPVKVERHLVSGTPVEQRYETRLASDWRAEP